jgi:hypothetical protein
VRREPRRPPAAGSNGAGEANPSVKAPRPPATPPSPRSGSIRNGVAALDASPGPSDQSKTPGPEGFAASEPQSVSPASVAQDAPLRESPAQEAGPGASGADTPQPSAGKIRSDAQRPFAPQPARRAAAPKRLWVVGAIVGVVVLLVAVAAYKLRDRPEDLAGLKPVAPSAPADAGANGKIVDRIGVGGAASDIAPSAGTVAASRKDAARDAAEAANPQVSVARRAALLVEAPDEQAKVKTFLGSVVWRVDNVSNGPGEPLTTAVRADVDIPEEKLQAGMTFQKNFDATLPASHTMKLNFVVAPGGPLTDIQQISVPQMRREDAATGDALSGVPVPITQNSFLVGLSRGNSEATNLELLRSREWIDIPMLLSNGRIAKLTFEKGPSGQRALDDALTSWQAQ